jgi:hypothetical protein
MFQDQDDDREMPVTDPGVVAILGFNPLDQQPVQSIAAHKYDADQPRDADGKWGAGAGTPAAHESKLRTSRVTASAEKSSDDDDHVNAVHFVQFDDGSKGVFKPADGEAPPPAVYNVQQGQQTEREVGAWEVAKLVGMQDLVAPAVEREVGGHRGVLMEFQEGRPAACIRGSDKFDGRADQERAAAFDFVIGNSDRHPGNWLAENMGKDEDGDPRYKLHLIDHGMAFPQSMDLPQVNHSFIDRMDDGSRSPKELATPYVAHWSEIKQTLERLNLPMTAIAGVYGRVRVLASSNDWSTAWKAVEPL